MGFCAAVRLRFTRADADESRDYRRIWPDLAALLIPRARQQFRRLHLLRLIKKKVTHTYSFYLTRLGSAAIVAACCLMRFSIIPAMAATH